MAGFSLAFGAMFSKTWRVHSIFTDVKLNKKVIKDYQLFMVVGVLLFIDIVIMTTWQVADPFYRETKQLEAYVIRPLEISTLFCFNISVVSASSFQRGHHNHPWKRVLRFGTHDDLYWVDLRLQRPPDGKEISYPLFFSRQSFVLTDVKQFCFSFFSVAFFLVRKPWRRRQKTPVSARFFLKFLLLFWFSSV